MAQLDALDAECLMFEQLSLDQLFKKLGINRSINRLSNEKIKIKAILFGESNKSLSHCAHLGTLTEDQLLVMNWNGKADFVERPSNKKSSYFMNLMMYFQPREDLFNKALLDSTKRCLFLSLLSKCDGVKSIDFGNLKLFDGFLLKVVQSCPEIECIKISKPFAKEDEWRRVLDQIGQKFIHFEVSLSGLMPMETKLLVLQKVSQMIEIVAEKCPNIKEVTVTLDWLSNWNLTSDLAAAFKTLPSSCFVKLACNQLNENVASQENCQAFEDVVNNLYVQSFDWSLFGSQINRLSKLVIYNLHHDDGHGVDFTGLKVLEFTHVLSSDAIKCLIASSFPRLEELRLNAANIIEPEYNALFQKMPLLKKLTISYDYENCHVSQLPLFAIRHLTKLETMCIHAVEGGKFQRENFPEHVVKYVDEISWLRKKFVDPRGFFDLWKKVLISKVNLLNERLKTKQSRLKFELLLDKNDL